MGDEVQQLLVIDTDCGVDDALAIALAVKYANVLAITCCHGNVSLQHVWKNVNRVLTFAGKEHIPVYSGCERPLSQEPVTDSEFHGRDGFGEVGHEFQFDEKKKPNDEPAAVALVRLAKQLPQKITLVALGPLTNLAIAQRLDSKFSSNLARVVFMGGNVTGFGNIEVSSEFNFHCDPEAANVLLNEFTCPLLCVPWEPCFTGRILWAQYKSLCNLKTKNSDFFGSVTRLTAEWVEKAGLDGFFPCDLYAMAFVLRPRVASAREKRHVVVELQGPVTRGEMIVDRRPSSERVPNADLVVGFDPKLMLNFITEFLKSE